jgi:hypothetical protein
MGMKVGNLMLDGETADYIWRGKGGKQGHRELPQPALNAISAALGAYGKEMAVYGQSDELIWPSKSHQGKGLANGTLYCNLQRYF